jgi:hypothetical protein
MPNDTTKRQPRTITLAELVKKTGISSNTFTAYASQGLIHRAEGAAATIVVDTALAYMLRTYTPRKNQQAINREGIDRLLMQWFPDMIDETGYVCPPLDVIAAHERKHAAVRRQISRLDMRLHNMRRSVLQQARLDRQLLDTQTRQVHTLHATVESQQQIIDAQREMLFQHDKTLRELKGQIEALTTPLPDTLTSAPLSGDGRLVDGLSGDGLSGDGAMLPVPEAVDVAPTVAAPTAPRRWSILRRWSKA